VEQRHQGCSLDTVVATSGADTVQPALPDPVEDGGWRDGAEFRRLPRSEPITDFLFHCELFFCVLCNLFTLDDYNHIVYPTKQECQIAK
jgi:hypothetical protein